METLQFEQYALGANLAAFSVAAIVCWIAGTRVARYADIIATRAGIGHVAAGLLLLGSITSLPEAAVAIFAALAGNPALAATNLIGEIPLQRAILAGVDGFIGREALTAIVASQTLLLQASLCILLLAVTAAALSTGDVAVWGVGLWSWTLLALYILSVWTIAKSQKRQVWVAQNLKQRAVQMPDPDPLPEPEQDSEQDSLRDSIPDSVLDPQIPGHCPAQGNARNVRNAASIAAGHGASSTAAGASPAHIDDSETLRGTIGKTIGAAAIILVAGFILSSSGEAIAAQTGLGQSFVGAVLLAAATSLPELSSVISAVRLRQYEMAISDILGTNMFSLALIFLVDAAYADGPVFNALGEFALIATLLGLLLSVVYLVGLIERRDRTFGRMGIDSLTTLLVYFGGLLLLYQLR